MNIKDYFTAESQSMMEFFITNGQGLYIPAYQRQFTWDEEKLSKLFTDSVHGLQKLIEHEDSVTFIGTVIAIHDTTNSTVNPPNKSGLPSRVMTIIDGQQRLTSLLMLSTALHEKIAALKAACQIDYDTEEGTWIEDSVSDALGNLTKCIVEEQNSGQNNFKWYPRMTRSYQDVWDKRQGVYKSPIGKHLFEYGIYAREIMSGNSKKVKKYNFLEFVEEKDQGDGSVYIKFNDGLNSLRKYIKNLIDGKEEEFPTDSDILTSKILPEAILNNQVIPDSVHTLLKNDPQSNFAKLTRLIVFANFVLKRIGLTVVTAKTEDYAFDIFEALNTTGEPLTAYETFKPKVIYKSTLKDYSDSPAKVWMSKIDHFFDNREDSKKQDITSRLLISFALSESGTKLSSRITDQRAYLRAFDKIPDDSVEKQLSFIKSLACTADFYDNVWTSDFKNINDFTTDHNEQSQAKLCIEVLKALKHNLALGPLIRYYSDVILSKDDSSVTDSEKMAKKRNFIEALKACTVFSIFWRGSRKGVAGIDAEYRNLMSAGFPGHLQPLARVNKAGTQVNTLPPVNDLKRFFCRVLSDHHIKNRDDWVKLASELPQYSNNKTLTKFLILASMHDAIPDRSQPGLLKKGRSGVCPTLTVDNWRAGDTASIEHIAPQNDARPSDWGRKEYDDLYNSVAKDKLHQLGNLTILNIPDNSLISDRSWNDKRVLYKALSAKDDNEIEELEKSAIQLGISKDTIDGIREKNTYVHFVEAIALCTETHWTSEVIDRRSKSMAGLIWDNIFPWLQPNGVKDDLTKAIVDSPEQ